VPLNLPQSREAPRLPTASRQRHGVGRNSSCRRLPLTGLWVGRLTPDEQLSIVERQPQAALGTVEWWPDRRSAGMRAYHSRGARPMPVGIALRPQRRTVERLHRPSGTCVLTGSRWSNKSATIGRAVVADSSWGVGSSSASVGGDRRLRLRGLRRCFDRARRARAPQTRGGRSDQGPSVTDCNCPRCHRGWR
jgi:hypothetical protein